MIALPFRLVEFNFSLTGFKKNSSTIASFPCQLNKSPREACKTKHGKAKVTKLIRGMGSPTTYGVKVPRQAMLLERGLPQLTEPAAGE